MKKVLGWLKKNLVSVICLVVAVVALPTMFIVGSGMGKGIREEVEADANKRLRDLNAMQVEYQLEPLTPDGQQFTVKIPPNEATTAAMGKLLEQTRTQFEGARALVVEHNQRGRGPLIDALFPAPENEIIGNQRLYEIANRRVAAYPALLQRIGAGGPPNPEDVARRLADARLREEELRRGARPDASLTEQDTAEIMERLSAERMQIYLSHAAGLRYYATPAVFEGVAPWSESVAPPLDTAWEWQWQYWVHEDIATALASANQGGSLLNGPVKRVSQIAVDTASYGAASQPGSNDPTAEAPRDFAASLSGRVAWPRASNGLYDIRYVTVRALVDADRLPDVIDAISRTNLMTVLDVDLEMPADLRQDLAAGYAYSRAAERLMWATMRIETIWLRDWTTPLMPARVAAALGVPGAAAQAGMEPTESGNQGRSRPSRDSGGGGGGGIRTR